MMSLQFVNPSKNRPHPALATAIAGALIVGAAGIAFSVWKWRVAAPPASLVMADRFISVRPMTLDVTITQAGELQAVENIDIISRVEGRTTITDIVKEGAYVKKDEILVQLDSQAIRQQIDDITLELERAEASVSNAREMLAIQESNNAAELEGANVALLQAELDLKKYVEGTYPQEEKTATTKLEMARINLQNKLDDLQQAKSLFTRGFVTAAEVKKADLAVTEAKNSVQETETGLRVLRQYNHQADLAAKQNSVAQARSKLERVRRQNESMIVQKTADLNSAGRQLELRVRRLDYMKDQLANCTMRAPGDGMVVYVNNPDNQQGVVQQGGEVRERQPILRLPDVSAMKAVLKLNEAQANRVHVGMRASIEITGIPAPLGGTVSKVSIVPVSGNRWVNPDSKEYPAEIVLDQTPPQLKPSTSAKSTILVKSLTDVLAVPLDTIYSVGLRSFVFVEKPGAGPGVEPREVQLGDASVTHVQIRDGLSANQRVLRLEAGQGKLLLEQANIKIEPATQPTAPRNGPANPADPRNTFDGAPGDRRGAADDSTSPAANTPEGGRNGNTPRVRPTGPRDPGAADAGGYGGNNGTSGANGSGGERRRRGGGGPPPAP